MGSAHTIGKPLMPLGVDPNLAMTASNENPQINVTTYISAVTQIFTLWQI